MMGDNDNAGVPMIYHAARATWIFEVARPGYWAFMKFRDQQVAPICSRDLNNAPPGSNEVYKPRRKQSHLQIVS